MAETKDDYDVTPSVSLDTLNADLCLRLPHKLRTRLLSFLVLGKTGNFEINIVAGKIRRYNVKDYNEC